MAIRSVEFTVDNNMNVSPSATVYGGVQGEHNATEVVFRYAADSPLTSPELDLHIEVMTSVGGYDKTNVLKPDGNSVHTLVPLAWTQYGAVTTLRLVAERNGEVAYTVEGRIRFDERQTAMDKVDGLMRTTIGEAMAVCERVAKLDPVIAAANANEAAEKATEAADAASAVEERVRDGGYIESLKEMNSGGKVRVWVGDEEEYENLEKEHRVPQNTLCIVGNGAAADYVTEHVDNGMWTLQKWASGIQKQEAKGAFFNGDTEGVLTYACNLCYSGFNGVVPIQIGGGAKEVPSDCEYRMGVIVCNGNKESENPRISVTIYGFGTIFTNINVGTGWLGWYKFSGTAV